MLDVLYDATEIKERDSSPPACEHTHCVGQNNVGADSDRVQEFNVSANSEQPP